MKNNDRLNQWVSKYPPYEYQNEIADFNIKIEMLLNKYEEMNDNIRNILRSSVDQNIYHSHEMITKTIESISAQTIDIIQSKSKSKWTTPLDLEHIITQIFSINIIKNHTHKRILIVLTESSSLIKEYREYLTQKNSLQISFEN